MPAERPDFRPSPRNDPCSAQQDQQIALVVAPGKPQKDTHYNLDAKPVNAVISAEHSMIVDRLGRPADSWWSLPEKAEPRPAAGPLLRGEARAPARSRARPGRPSTHKLGRMPSAIKRRAGCSIAPGPRDSHALATVPSLLSRTHQDTARRPASPSASPRVELSSQDIPRRHVRPFSPARRPHRSFQSPLQRVSFQWASRLGTRRCAL